MWPQIRRTNELVSFIFSPHSLTCSWIQSVTKSNRAPLQLCAYRRFSLTDLQLENGTIFNPTALKKMITTFLNTHNQQNAFISFCLSDPAVTQRYVTLPKNKPKRSDFTTHDPNTYAWNYQRIYQYDGQSTFYLYSLPKTLILQHQLLAIGLRLNLTRITTTESALFYLYKYIHNSAFRQAQLAVDMIKHHNKLDLLVSLDNIRRVIQLPTGFTIEQELLPIATACGLFIIEKEPL